MSGASAAAMWSSAGKRSAIYIVRTNGARRGSPRDDQPVQGSGEETERGVWSMVRGGYGASARVVVRVRVGARIRGRVGVRVGMLGLAVSAMVVAGHWGLWRCACAGAIWASSLIESTLSSSPATSCEEGC
eukprot:scaffold38739_cov53-Phaeocystis_antarctica.AAC.2